MTNIELGASYPFWENRTCESASIDVAPLFVKMDDVGVLGIHSRDFSMLSSKILVEIPYFESHRSEIDELYLINLLYSLFDYSQFSRRTMEFYSIIFEKDKTVFLPFFATLLKQLTKEPQWHAWQIAIVSQFLIDLNRIPIDKGPVIRQSPYHLELCSEAEVKFLTAIQENDMVLVDGHLLVKSHRESNKDVRGYLAGLCIRSATYPNGTYFQSGVWYCPTDRKAIRASFAQNGQIDISASAWVAIRPFYPSNLNKSSLEELVQLLKSIYLLE